MFELYVDTRTLLRPRHAWLVAVLALVLVSFPVDLHAQDVRSKPGCIYNCLNEKTKGWLADKLPGMEELSKILTCKKCLEGDATECIKCINDLVTEVPGLGEIIEASKCVYDCRNCSAANPDECPEEWSCVDGTYCWCSKSGTDWRSKVDKVFEDLVEHPTYQCRTCKDGQWVSQGSQHCSFRTVCHDHPPGKVSCEDPGQKCNYKSLPPD